MRRPVAPCLAPIRGALLQPSYHGKHARCREMINLCRKMKSAFGRASFPGNPLADKHENCGTEDVVMKQQERYRVCAVCGRRHGPTFGYQFMLVRLGIRGECAAPGCVAKFFSLRKGRRRLHQTNIDHD